jgi:hypothetical protein
MGETTAEDVIAAKLQTLRVDPSRLPMEEPRSCEVEYTIEHDLSLVSLLKPTTLNDEVSLGAFEAPTPERHKLWRCLLSEEALRVLYRVLPSGMELASWSRPRS